MTSRFTRITVSFAIALFLFMTTGESLPTEGINGNEQDFENHLGNISTSLETEADVSDWKYETHCMDKDNLACKEVGMLVNGRQYPKKLRIPRASKLASDIDDMYYLDSDPSTSCVVPSGTKTAEIRCKLWPSSIKCYSYCVYGFTFPEGIKRQHFCKYKENKWSEEFEECKPFIDCMLKLVSPGDVRCVRNEVTNSPKCEVQCEMYEDKDETKKQIYSCNSNAKWSPALPFCVQPKGGAILAKTPQVTEHSRLTYP